MYNSRNEVYTNVNNGGILMKCFNHKERDAVAICKYCGKGLCEECAVQIDDVISCKGKCEEKVRKQNELIDTSEKLTIKTKKNVTQSYYGSAFLAFIVGVFFIGIVLYEDFPEELNVFFLGCGVIMFVAAVLRLVQGNNYKK